MAIFTYPHAKQVAISQEKIVFRNIKNYFKVQEIGYITYQISSKSKMVWHNPFVDLTWNDPTINSIFDNRKK